MKAAVVTDKGVRVREVAKPTPGPEQVLVLVRVRAAGLAEEVMPAFRWARA
jgi:NADPH:quinone reductase-like Zn-dependent oxidoreductase